MLVRMLHICCVALGVRLEVHFKVNQPRKSSDNSGESGPIDRRDPRLSVTREADLYVSRRVAVCSDISAGVSFDMYDTKS